jgi:hypothetical protein
MPISPVSVIKSRNWPINQLPGLGPEDCQRLLGLGIHSTFDLLRQSQTRQSQTQLAQKLQLHIHHIQKWIALSDLARVPAVGIDACGLLLHAGVISVECLAKLSPGLLHRQILKLQVTNLQRPDLCPNAAQIGNWINQAQQLPKLPRPK